MLHRNGKNYREWLGVREVYMALKMTMKGILVGRDIIVHRKKDQVD